jgi:hypothetical protein
MTDPGVGGFDRLRYDRCAYARDLYESTSPMKYMLYEGKYENCGKCVYDEHSFYRPFDLVDQESELKNITRLASKCTQFKYSPTCKDSKTCTSTFSKSVPIVMAQECCPIIHNNINKMTVPGFVPPELAFCGAVNRK